MKGKICLACMSLILLTNSAYCKGLYFGTGLGPEYLVFKQKAHISQLSNFNAIDKTHLGGVGIFGDIFAGFDWNFCNYYLAGEVNFSGTNAKFKSSNNEYIHSNYAHTTYNLPYSYDI